MYTPRANRRKKGTVIASGWRLMKSRANRISRVNRSTTRASSAITTMPPRTIHARAAFDNRPASGELGVAGRVDSGIVSTGWLSTPGPGIVSLDRNRAGKASPQRGQWIRCPLCWCSGIGTRLLQNGQDCDSESMLPVNGIGYQGFVANSQHRAEYPRLAMWR
jgi:hypothetical protein